MSDYKGVEVYCNYCSFPHRIFTGETLCPNCGKPAGKRPQEWTAKIHKPWEIKK